MTLLAQNQHGRRCLILVGLVAGVIVLVVFGVFAAYFRLWIQSFLTRAGIGFRRSAGHVVPQGQCQSDRAQQDHGGAGRT